MGGVLRFCIPWLTDIAGPCASRLIGSGRHLEGLSRQAIPQLATEQSGRPEFLVGADLRACEDALWSRFGRVPPEA